MEYPGKAPFHNGLTRDRGVDAKSFLFHDKRHVKNEGKSPMIERSGPSCTMETLLTYIKDNSMTHSIFYNPQTRIIETITEGIVNSNEFREIFSQAVQLAKEKGCFLFLNDFRKATFAMSTLDFYNLPKILSGISTSQGIHANRLRRAIVVAPKDTRDAVFAENVTVNRGQRARIFLEMDEAREWLLGRS